MSFTIAARDRLRDRVSGGAAAVAAQAGLLALLVFSFEVVRHVAAEKETILTLPPLVKVVPRPPVTIDARGRTRPAPATPQAASPVQILPSFSVTAPQEDGVLLQQPGRDIAECRGGASGTRKACAPDRPRDDGTMAPAPEPAVRNAPVWQSEIERRNTPPRVPCVSLTNNVVGMNGFVREDHGARIDIGCALKAWREGPALLPPVEGAPDPDPPPAHATDEAFGKALQTVNARKRALYGKAAPMRAAPAGGAP